MSFPDLASTPWRRPTPSASPTEAAARWRQRFEAEAERSVDDIALETPEGIRVRPLYGQIGRAHV